MIYDGGLRRATVEQFRAQYDQTVANYRGTVLTAFQQVEDNLSTLRVLSKEIQEQDTAIQSAQRSLKLATDRYRLGIDPYLNVITAQTTLFGNQQTAVNLRIQQIVASVQLIEAVGGGWDSSTLPTSQQIISREAQSPAAPPVQPSKSQPPRLIHSLIGLANRCGLRSALSSSRLPAVGGSNARDPSSSFVRAWLQPCRKDTPIQKLPKLRLLL